MLALTGTADKDTEKTVIGELLMKNPVKLFVSPNRVNLRLSVHKVPRSSMLKHLDWLVDMIRQHGKDTPKTIIFCDTLYSIASVRNYMMMTLGEASFHPRSSRKHEHCLLGIFHSLSLKEYKERLLVSFKGQGLKRVAIATTALSMGVNFPDVRYIVHFGPARTLLDFHQQAGRAGRDGDPSDVIVFFYGQQLSHCEDDVRAFLKSTGCFRVASYSTFDPDIAPLLPLHDCCNFCAKSCTCDGSDRCTGLAKAFEKESSVERENPAQCRRVSDEEKAVVNDALSKMQSAISHGYGRSAFGSTSSHGFSKELISDVVANCHNLFSVEDILTNVPVFSRKHAIAILGILNEVFDDIHESNFTDVGTLKNDDNEYIFSGFDDLLSCSYEDFVEDFQFDPDSLPE